MINYLMNYRSLVDNLLPPVLRKDSLQAWIRVFSSVFRNHNSRQGLDEFLVFDTTTTEEEKALFRLNTIFQAPMTREDKVNLLSRALGEDGVNGIDEVLIIRLIDIAEQVGQLSGLQRLTTVFELSTGVVTEIEDRLNVLDLEDLFKGIVLSEEDSSLAFDIRNYTDKVYDLSFERFRRMQLYNVNLTGQTLVLENHLNTLYGLTDRFNRRIKRENQIRIENVASFAYTFFHEEEAVFENTLDDIPEAVISPDTIESIILFDKESEPLAFGEDIASDLLITGIIAGAVERGLPQAIEFFAVNDIPDLSEYSLNLVTRVSNDVNAIGNRTASYTFPLGEIVAGTHFYLSRATAGNNEEQIFEDYFGFAPTAGTDALILDDSTAVELIIGGNTVDSFGNASEGSIGNNTFWRYKGSWVYRTRKLDLLNPAFTQFDYLIGIEFPFVSQNDLLDLQEADFITNEEALRPFPLANFTLSDLQANRQTGTFIGNRNELNQGLGFDFKVICPDFIEGTRPFSPNTAEAANEFIIDLATEVNKFRLAGKRFVIEVEGTKVDGLFEEEGVFENTFDENFE